MKDLSSRTENPRIGGSIPSPGMPLCIIYQGARFSYENKAGVVAKALS